MLGNTALKLGLAKTTLYCVLACEMQQTDTYRVQCMKVFSQLLYYKSFLTFMCDTFSTCVFKTADWTTVIESSNSTNDSRSCLYFKEMLLVILPQK